MQISVSEYSQFQQLLENKSGILLGNNKQYLVSSRLANFLSDNGIASFGELLVELSKRSNDLLMQKVVDLMTTNETLWFRDSYPFEYMKRTLVPEFRKQGRFRIWCAACSSGQEPYSLSMLLDEASALSSAEIIASDLSSRILERARKGEYQEIELKRGMPDDKLRKYFSPIDENRWKINQQIRNSIRFQSKNLLSFPYNNGKFDVIFCRNVLIYFSQENKTKVLNGLIDSLVPGGYLVLGASESLTREAKPLEMVRCNPGLIYKKS